MSVSWAAVALVLADAADRQSEAARQVLEVVQDGVAVPGPGLLGDGGDPLGGIDDGRVEVDDRREAGDRGGQVHIPGHRPAGQEPAPELMAFQPLPDRVVVLGFDLHQDRLGRRLRGVEQRVHRAPSHRVSGPSTGRCDGLCGDQMQKAPAPPLSRGPGITAGSGGVAGHPAGPLHDCRLKGDSVHHAVLGIATSSINHGPALGWARSAPCGEVRAGWLRPTRRK